jgi:hypothetical protein
MDSVLLPCPSFLPILPAQPTSQGQSPPPPPLFISPDQTQPSTYSTPAPGQGGLAGEKQGHLTSVFSLNHWQEARWPSTGIHRYSPSMTCIQSSPCNMGTCLSPGTVGSASASGSNRSSIGGSLWCYFLWFSVQEFSGYLGC